MTPEEARRHAEHLCDVFVADGQPYAEHVGVIERLSSDARAARVSGHPEYGAKNFPVSALGTCCKVTT